jgi:hypothetical protein
MGQQGEEPARVDTVSPEVMAVCLGAMKQVLEERKAASGADGLSDSAAVLKDFKEAVKKELAQRNLPDIPMCGGSD